MRRERVGRAQAETDSIAEERQGGGRSREVLRHNTNAVDESKRAGDRLYSPGYVEGRGTPRRNRGCPAVHFHRLKTPQCIGDQGYSPPTGRHLETINGNLNPRGVLGSV